MMSRLLASFGIVTLMVGLASAQDQPETKQGKAAAPEKPAVEARVKEAIEVANDDMPKAISILDKALEVAPEYRRALFLQSYLTAIQADKVKEKSEKIALLHKSSATYAKLQKLYPDPTPNEQAFAVKSQLGEARALSLEGKTKESLATLKKAFEAGFNDMELIASEDDLEAVRKLPELQGLIETASKAAIEAEKKEIASEMAQFKPFPFDFELKDTDEKTVSLADYKGKVTIVDVWGTWCPPCRREIPHFVALSKELKGKGLEIVGINCNEEGTRDEVKETIKAFAKENMIEYKCLLNDDKTESKIPGFQGYPTTLFLDRTGKVRMQLVGAAPKARLEAIATTLLEESAEPKAK